MNLTAWRGSVLWERGIHESLGLGAYLGADSGRAIDIGSGGGFPGMVLAIAYPGWRWTLLDSRRRRVEFLAAVVERLELGNVDLVAARAEEWIREDSTRREGFHVVTMRAVAPLDASLELGLPLVSLSGSLLLAAGTSGPEEMVQAQPWVEQLGGQVHEWISPAPAVQAVQVIKVAPTPEVYPRRAKALGRWNPTDRPETLPPANSSSAE